MKQDHYAVSHAFSRFSKVVVFFTILLIWWGAATTTEEAGMVFADWPLSLGSINPPGWLSYTAPFLEHSHRLLATLVGLLVLALFLWVYCREKNGMRILEVLALVLVLAVIFQTFIKAGMERTDAVRKTVILKQAMAMSLIPITWLFWSWFGRKSWSSLQKLCALALLLVSTQAIFGGMRVTEINNTFATIHGCIAQLFFCLLILISLMANKGWQRAGYFSSTEEKGRVLQQWCGFGLTVVVVLQLVFGASMRHFQRSGLADTGLLMTQGKWIPNLDEPIIAVMFLHKFTGALLFLMVVVMLYLLNRASSPARVLHHLRLIVVLLTAQIALGLFVIVSGKNFWVTNFHVLNGLSILALSFVFLIRGMKVQH